MFLNCLPEQWTGLVQQLKFISDQKFYADLAQDQDERAEAVIQKANSLARHLIVSQNVENDGVEAIRWFENFRRQDGFLPGSTYSETDIQIVQGSISIMNLF